jgi:purine-binding chemotaxis protein CheW
MIRADHGEAFLLCRIGSRIGALAIKDVREIMRPLPIEPLAGSPPFVLGLAVLRGMATPVIDAGRLLDPATSSSPARFVALKLGERTAVLAVDDVLDVRAIGAEVLADIPPLMREASADLVSTIGTLDSRLLLVLESARMVPNSVWGEINARGTAA